MKLGEYFKNLGYRKVTEEDFETYLLRFRISDFSRLKISFYPEIVEYNKDIEMYIKVTKEEEDCEYYNLIFYDKGVFKIDLESWRPTAYGTKIDVVFIDDIQRYYELNSLEEVKEIQHLL